MEEEVVVGRGRLKNRLGIAGLDTGAGDLASRRVIPVSVNVSKNLVWTR